MRKEHRMASVVLALAVSLPLGCGDDDKPAPDAAAGSGGSGGLGGTGGTGGTAGTGGTGGVIGVDAGAGRDGAADAAVGAGDGAAPATDGAVPGTDGAAPATDGAAPIVDGATGDVATMGVMSFFVTSVPVGMGGNLGGLMGADKHCDNLAKGVSAQKKRWVAYLSNMVPPTNARDRIGTGPWYNQKGQLFAENLDKLHPMIDPATMRAAYIAAKPADALFLDEKGAAVPGNQHDILTGSDGQGRLVMNKTCKDWTSEAKGGVGDVAVLGHSDTPGNTQFSASWNSAHDSQGCGQADLVPTGGNGRLYCFATD